tara:strand:- start:22 stop:666 length:645 start_codon:yes stop_codon:yes gene_type:complete
MTAKIKLNAASGGGSFSLQAPSSSSNNRVFTLPDSADATLLTSTASLGKILQVKTNTTRDSTGSVHCNPTKTYIDIPDQNVTITPSAASSKIKISFHQFGETGSSEHVYSFKIKRAISGGATTIISAPSSGNKSDVLTQPTTVYYAADNNSTPSVAHLSNYLDSPNTTSAITYTVQIGNHESTGYYYYNRTITTNDAVSSELGLSWITVEEVAA